MAISSNYSAERTLAMDPSALGDLRRLARTDQGAAAKAVAQQFEALMVQQMLSAMRQASPSPEDPQGGAFGMFRSMQDQQFAQVAASSGTFGFADAILRQIEIQQAPSRLQQVIPSTGARVEQIRVSPAPASAAGAAKPAASSASPAGFLEKLVAPARAAAEKIGVDPQWLLAHAALETGWGERSIKTANGGESHNLFGIKATRSWPGKTTDVTTTEYVGGVAQKRIETFRVYGSYEEAFADYASLIRQRYGAASGAENSAAYGKALQAGGYATDPQYGEKFANVARSVADRLARSQSRITA
jgi:peptidoglycan hydrolase FlgJ